MSKLDYAEMTDKEKIAALIDLINDICRDVRERYGKDDVCGLCEYDADHGLDGDANECPGFETDRCFVLSDEFLKKYSPDRKEGRAHWKVGEVDAVGWAECTCSNCGYGYMTDEKPYNYCPDCGAKMDETEENKITK